MPLDSPLDVELATERDEKLVDDREASQKVYDPIILLMMISCLNNALALNFARP